MKLKEMSKQEIELLGYDDIANLILEEEKKPMKINILFQKVCDLLELSSQIFEDKIADFFELLTTDKRFVLLEDGSWDLKCKHTIQVVMDDDDIETDFEVEENEDEKEDDIFFDEEENEEKDDDLKDLVIINDEDEE